MELRNTALLFLLVVFGFKTILNVSAQCEYGLVYGFGQNDYGQLGDNTTEQRNVPVETYASGVLSGKTVIQVAAGGSHTLLLTSNGKVFAMGHNYLGQLGDGTYNRKSIPVAVYSSGVLSGKNVTQIAAGYEHSLVLTSEGKIYGFGNNNGGQLGNTLVGSDSFVPAAVDTSGALSGKTVVQIAAGDSHSVVLTSDGNVYTWLN